jgi:hypothetical protein
MTRSSLAGAAVALAIGGVLLAAPTASAEPSAVLAGTFYLYEHDDYNGGVAGFTGSDSDLSNNSWAGGPGRIVNNNASSMKNNSDRDVVLYDVRGSCTGDAYLARKHSVDSDLTNNGFDNKASCVRFG